MTTPKRSRTIEWEDPQLLVEAMNSGLTGLQFLEKFVRRELPGAPMAMLMDFAIVEVSPGRAVFAVEPAEFHYNPIGVVHGGLAATLLDSAMGCAIQSMLPAGVGYSTLEIKVNFIRAITSTTGLVRSEATVVHVGRSTATAEGRVVDKDGKLYAHATTTCIILQGGSV